MGDQNRNCDCGGVCGSCRGVALAKQKPRTPSEPPATMAQEFVDGNDYLINVISEDCLAALNVRVPGVGCPALIFWNPNEVMIGASRGLTASAVTMWSMIASVITSDYTRSSLGEQQNILNATNPTEAYSPPSSVLGGKREIGIVNYELTRRDEGLNQELSIQMGPAIDASMQSFTNAGIRVKFKADCKTSNIFCMFAQPTQAPGGTTSELSVPRIIETYNNYAGLFSSLVSVVTFPAGAAADDFTVTRRFFDPAVRAEHLAFLYAIYAKAGWR